MNKKKPGKNSLAKWSPTQLLEAIRGSDGVKSHVYKQLGMAPVTLDALLAAHPALLAALRTAGEELLDDAETALYRKVREGDEKAIEYVLNCRGRARGWGAAPAAQIGINVGEGGTLQAIFARAQKGLESQKLKG